MDVVNLADKLRQFTEAWSPKIVGDVNDMQVKVVKLRGEFVWHHHDVEDELFLVVAGRLRMRLRTGDRDVALNTGNVTSDRTVAEPGRI